MAEQHAPALIAKEKDVAAVEKPRQKRNAAVETSVPAKTAVEETAAKKRKKKNAAAARAFMRNCFKRQY